MAGNEAVVHTDSEKTSSYKFVKKRAVQLTIKFKIEEFEALMNTTEPGEKNLWSEGVSSELAPRAIWNLWVWPNGLEEEDRGEIGVFLCLTGPMKDDGETLDSSYQLYFITGTGGRINLGKRDTDNFGRSVWGRYVSHEQVRKALHEDGSLLLAADVEFLPPHDSALHDCKDQWPTKFSRFYSDAASSDCSIQIGGVTIPAHKLFLMACSPVFEAMLTNPAMEESKSGVVEISDFPPEPVRALVRYCYTGLLDDTTLDGDGAMEIFKLADKYWIDDLKAQLEEHFIKKRLSVGNVIEMAKLADMHSAMKLKKACTKLIAEEWDTVSASAEWKRLEEEMPELAAELAEAATTEE